jgi:hypothetical protein
LPARSLKLTSGLENGTRTINNPEAHVEDYWRVDSIHDDKAGGEMNSSESY